MQSKHYENWYNWEYQELQDAFRKITNSEHREFTGYNIEDDQRDEFGYERDYFIERCDENNYKPLF